MILTQRLDFALRLLFVGEACPSSSLNFTIQRYGSDFAVFEFFDRKISLWSRK